MKLLICTLLFVTSFHAFGEAASLDPACTSAQQNFESFQEQFSRLESAYADLRKGVYHSCYSPLGRKITQDIEIAEAFSLECADLELRLKIKREKAEARNALDYEGTLVSTYGECGAAAPAARTGSPGSRPCMFDASDLRQYPELRSGCY